MEPVHLSKTKFCFFPLRSRNVGSSLLQRSRNDIHELTLRQFHESLDKRVVGHDMSADGRFSPQSCAAKSSVKYEYESPMY